MNKTAQVLRYEIVTAVTRKSFLFIAFGMPLLAVLIFLVALALKGHLGSAAGDSGDSTGEMQLRVEGYVDRSGLIAMRHPDVPEHVLVAFSDEMDARQALNAGEIAAYYVIPEDYVQHGDLIYVNPDYSLIATKADQSWTMRRTIFANLLGNDSERIERVWPVMDVQVTALAPSKVHQDQDSPLAFYIPYGTMMIFNFVILMSASLLLNSVGGEKKDRVMEQLLVSLSPRQMLTGKILGLGMVGLLQAMIWLGTAYTLLRVGGQTFRLPAGLEPPVSLLMWGVVFFLLGYAVYASLMAGLGALAPSVQEASQATIVVIWPLLLPLFFVAILIEDTHGAIATGFSLFPLTAPVAMMTRLAVGGVPLWQPLLSAALMLIAFPLIVRGVSRMYHAQTLLSGQRFSAKRFWGALVGRGRFGV